MEKKAMKNMIKDTDMVVDEFLVDEFLVEIDELLHKYPQDPNKTDLNEEKLEQLILDLDKNWMSFKRRWKTRLDVEKVVGTANVRKDGKGIRHLVIRSEAAPDPLIDLVVPDKDSPSA